MPLPRAREHREQLEALISRGVGITEIQRTLGLSYATIRDMIRLLHLPKPLDQRTQPSSAHSRDAWVTVKVNPIGRNTGR